jgi:hypothetical protein
MVRKALFYSAVLIGTYIAVAHATGGGKLLAAGSSGAAKLVKTFQGRG